MSEQNLEVIRVFFGALEREDFPAALRLFDPEVEWSTAEGDYRGLLGVTDSFAEWMEPWDEHKIEAEEFVECGDDQVLATIHLTARGEHTGMEVDQHFFQVYTLRDGKIIRMVEYLDRARALEAAKAKE